MHSMTIAEIIVVAWCFSIILADVSSRRVPNVLTVGICLLALCWLIFTGRSMLHASLPSVVVGTVIGLLFTVPAYVSGLLGAGDVKLLLAIALLGGAYLTLSAFVIASILAMIFLAAHALFFGFSRHSEKPKRWIPFGAALSAGLLCAIGITP